MNVYALPAYMNVYVMCMCVHECVCEVPSPCLAAPHPPPKRKAPSETTLREDPDHT